jgi:hypothetical protein
MPLRIAHVNKRDAPMCHPLAIQWPVVGGWMLAASVKTTTNSAGMPLSVAPRLTAVLVPA